MVSTETIIRPATARRIKSILSVVAVSCFLMAGIVSLPGCAMVPNPLQQTVNDERALYAAEAAYNGVLLSVNSLIDQGVIIPGSPEALRLADRLDGAKTVLNLSRQAYAAGNATNGYSLALQALALAADIQKALK